MSVPAHQVQIWPPHTYDQTDTPPLIQPIVTRQLTSRTASSRSVSVPRTGWASYYCSPPCSCPSVRLLKCSLLPWIPYFWMISGFVSNLVLSSLLSQDFHPGIVVDAQRCKYMYNKWLLFTQGHFTQYLPQNCNWLQETGLKSWWLWSFFDLLFIGIFYNQPL